MITEDEVMRLLEQADPARRLQVAPSVNGDTYLHALHTRSTTATLTERELTSPGSETGHRWPIIAGAAAAVVAIVVSVLWLIARGDDPSNQLPAGTTVPPDTAVNVDVPLAEGIYRTPDLTRDQLIATGIAAGFDRADVEEQTDTGLGSFETVQVELQLADGDWEVNVWLDGWKGSRAWRGTYQVVDDDTVTATDDCLITYDYTFDGEQLSLDMVDDQCRDGGLAELIAQTSTYETAPFTLVEPTDARASATTPISVASDGN